MHIPDGFLELPAAAAGAAVAAAGVAVAVRRTGDSLGEREVPLAALTSAFVFAAQMVNFPVASGTSGHLMGGVLAAVLVGPWAAVLCITVVLGVQALLFADGGLTALGVNVVNLALVGGLGGHLLFLALRRALGRRPSRLPLAAGVAAALSVPLAAVAFVAEFALGGAAAVDLGRLGAAMVGTHVLIGVGEGAITAAAVGAVLSSRPDLVHGARLDLGAPVRSPLAQVPAR